MYKLRNTINIVLVVALFHCISMLGQVEYSKLEVGDQVPDFELENLINGQGKSRKISDYKGKLLILDIWGVHCASCIRSWPKLMKLQNQFTDEIQIVIVNPFEEKEKVKKIFEKREGVIGEKITLLSSNVGKDGRYRTMINQLFPRSSVPHVIWINPEGIIVGITYGTTINEKNIKAILQGEDIELTKIDNGNVWPVVYSEPLYIHNNGGMYENVFWQSSFTRASKWLSNVQHFSNDGTAVAINSSVKDLYRLAYTTDKNLNTYVPQLLLPKYVSLEVKDSTLYVGHSESGIRDEDRFFTYQLIAPPGTAKEKLRASMQSDLDRYIGLDAVWEKRVKKCLVLRAMDTLAIQYREGQKISLNNNLTYMKINKYPVAEMFKRLELDTPGYYNTNIFIDETGFKGLLGNIEVETDLSNIDSLNKALEKYTLKFSVEYRKVNILVIREPEGYVFPYSQEVPEKLKTRREYNQLRVLINKAEYEKDWPTYVRCVNKLGLNHTKTDYAKRIISEDTIKDKYVLNCALNWINEFKPKASNTSKQELDRFKGNIMFKKHNSAILLYRLERYQESLEMANDALELAEEINFVNTKFKILNVIEKIKKEANL
ncbi:TlpA family protein disulfide reductase [Flagellimonas sp.]|uniref:TlpA family protein disulfide reductase n=1 Tax=Flagellimonas sp. TaxID=2058762 RepID=UPI003AB47CF3